MRKGAQRGQGICLTGSLEYRIQSQPSPRFKDSALSSSLSRCPPWLHFETFLYIREQQTFFFFLFWKWPDILGLAGHTVSITIPQLYHCGTEEAVDNM